MQERVIENWLISANELSFTVPYSQILALQGHKILYISPKKATLEQGKDIISVDPSGVVHCHQLKGADITTERWRSEVKPEVDAMMDLIPKHPSLKEPKDWQCHLVVNGEFKGEATREVVDYQEARTKAGRRSFDTVVRGELLNEFKVAYGKYLPRELDDFTAFIDMYREDGREPLDKDGMSRLLVSFFSDVLVDTKAPTKNAIRQQINAAIVSMSYLLANKYKQENYIGLTEGWLILLSYVFAVAEKTKLEEKYWQPAVEVIETVLDDIIDELVAEVSGKKHYAEPGGLPFSDAYVYKIRATIVAGYLTAYCNYKRIGGEPSRHEAIVTTFIKKTIDEKLLSVRGEGQVPLVANASVYLSQVGLNDERNLLILACLDGILLMNDKGGLYDPYYDIQDIIRSELNITLRPIIRRFGHTSYTLHSLVLILAKFGERQLLEDRWRELSHISYHEFIPKEPWQWLLWRSQQGKAQGRFPNQTQSWKELQKESNAASKNMPALMTKRPKYIPLFLALMPHRMTASSVTLITSNI